MATRELSRSVLESMYLLQATTTEVARSGLTQKRVTNPSHPPGWPSQPPSPWRMPAP